MARPSIAGLGGLRRQLELHRYLRWRYGDAPFSVSDFNSVLMSETVLPDFIRSQWVKLVKENLGVLPAMSSRVCEKCKRQENPALAKSCQACQAPLEPLKGLEKLLRSWSPLKSPRGCAMIRSEMVLHGEIERLPDGLLRAKRHRNPDQDERWRAAWLKERLKGTPQGGEEQLQYVIVEELARVMPSFARIAAKHGLDPGDEILDLMSPANRKVASNRPA